MRKLPRLNLTFKRRDLLLNLEDIKNNFLGMSIIIAKNTMPLVVMFLTMKNNVKKSIECMGILKRIELQKIEIF